MPLTISLHKRAYLDGFFVFSGRAGESLIRLSNYETFYSDAGAIYNNFPFLNPFSPPKRRRKIPTINFYEIFLRAKSGCKWNTRTTI